MRAAVEAVVGLTHLFALVPAATLSQRRISVASVLHASLQQQDSHLKLEKQFPWRS